MTLPKQVFLALTYVGWVDGQLQRVEAQALLRAAKEAGLAPDDLAEVEAATKAKIDLGALDLSGLAPKEQLLCYALGTWIAQVDGVVSTSEHQSLVEIGKKLGLDESLQKRAAVAAYDIACMPGEGKPDRYDFTKLRARLEERIPQVK
jgi:uncharacterized tellurite resistance protein B-like protein